MDLKKTYPWYFALAAIFIYSIFCFLPGIMGIFYSFTDWNAFSLEINFVGLRNFIDIFSADKMYKTYVVNTVTFTVITTISKTVFGIFLALLLTNKKVGIVNFHRMVMFSPQIMSYLIVGLVFKSLLHPSSGFVNYFFKSVGFDFFAQKWLADLKFAFPTVMAVDTWKGTGYVMVVIIAGLKSISPTYYEAAEIDGASYWAKFRHITLPLLVPVLTNVTILNITYGFRVFDIIYSLTNGGPGNATGVINTAVYKEFSIGNYAMGTTLSSVLFVFIMAISYFILKSMENKEVIE